MALVTKQMYPKSLEIDKTRRTDDRCSHPAGQSAGSFPSVLWMFVSQQEFCCSHIVELEEGPLGRVPLKAVIQLEPQNRDHCRQGRETMEPLSSAAHGRPLTFAVVCKPSLSVPS